MITTRELKLYRKKLKLEYAEKGENLPVEWMDDATVISKWYHNSNIEASEELLKRLKEYHPEFDQ